MEQLKKLHCNKSSARWTWPKQHEGRSKEVAVLLTKLCDSSFKTATELEDWTIAKVIPIFLIGLKVITEITLLWVSC